MTLLVLLELLSQIRLFMPERAEPQDDVDVEELHSEAGSEHDEINRDLFKDIAFFLHKSIKKNFSRRNLIRDIVVRREPLDLTRLIIDSISFAETRRNCTGHRYWLRHSSRRCHV